MKNIGKYLYGMLGLLVVFTWMSCVEVEVKEKTQGEQVAQSVLKDYDDLSKKWMVASLRKEQDQPEKKEEVKFSEAEKMALSSMTVRAQDTDDVTAYKRLGYIGEGNNGFLKWVNPPKDPELWKKVNEVMMRENKNRKAIMKGIIQMDPQLDEAQINQVEKTFSKKFVDESDPGVHIENPDGTWRIKQ